jgi:hypothetical protein
VKRTLATLALATGIIVSGPAAYAGYAYQSSDVSYGINTNSRVRVCDKESDGHGVHTDSYNFSGNYFRADDPDGAGGYCGDTAYMGGVYRHRTVEEIDNAFDYYGDWSYH